MISIATIAQLQKIAPVENGEPLEELDLLCDYRRKDSGINKILVRKTVAEKLIKIQKKLPFQLMVVEGYRSPIYQERYFLKQLLESYDSTLDLDTNLELTHQMVALPSVAGHPTGGAIDITLAKDGKEIDMGCPIADFSNPKLLPTYSDSLTPEQKKYRLLLHDAMIEEGFAPFYGEWWHFSYGDRE